MGSVELIVPVGFFKERNQIVEIVEVETGVHIDVALAIDHVAQGRAVFHRRTAFPAVGGVIRDVCVQKA